MTAGRKVIPISIKQAKGTHRPHRDRETYTPADGKPFPPAWLNTRAKMIFRRMSGRLNKIQRASETHTEVLALLASSMEEVERFSKMLDECKGDDGKPQNGYVYATTNSFGDPILKEHPVVKCREKAMRRSHSLLAELGLTPASMQKVGTPKQSKEKNPFSGF